MAWTSSGRALSKVLLLNPNSSEHMTADMMRAIDGMPGLENIRVTPYTAPGAAPPSINDGADIKASEAAVLGDSELMASLADYDGVLVACYSVHPLAHSLRRFCSPRAQVLGIYEASLWSAVELLSARQSRKAAGKDGEGKDGGERGTAGRWGIVTTGPFWEKHFEEGVARFLGAEAGGGGGLAGYTGTEFAGVVASGSNASDFHEGDEGDGVEKDGGKEQPNARDRIRVATRKLANKGVDTPLELVILGCGGMVDMVGAVRAELEELYGLEKAADVVILDTIRNGVLQLGKLVQTRMMFTTGS